MSAKGVNLSWGKLGSEGGAPASQPLLKQPTLQVSVVGIGNLSTLEVGPVEPYVILSYGKQKKETPVMLPEDEHPSNTFEFPVIKLQPLKIKVMDKDSLGKDTLISSILVPESCFGLWRGDVHDVYVKIEEGSFSENEEGYMRECTLGNEVVVMDENEVGESAFLHLRLRYLSEHCLSLLAVSIRSHFIRSTALETYTVYTVDVSRGDGHTWTLQVRYSQVHGLKTYLAGLFPEFHVMDFPSKTIFECLAGLCPSLSRFDAERIEARKVGMTRFLNAALSKQKHLSDPVLDLLQASIHRRSRSTL